MSAGVVVNVPITLYRNTAITNQSASAELVFLQNIATTPGSGGLRVGFRPSGNTIRFGNGLVSGAEFWSTNVNAGRYVIDTGGARLNSFSIAPGVSELDLIGNLTLTGLTSGSGTMNINRIGPGDRLLQLGARPESVGPGEQIRGDATAVWAILDHNSDFAVIPESGIFTLFASLTVNRIKPSKPLPPNAASTAPVIFRGHSDGASAPAPANGTLNTKSVTSAHPTHGPDNSTAQQH